MVRPKGFTKTSLTLMFALRSPCRKPPTSHTNRRSQFPSSTILAHTRAKISRMLADSPGIAGQHVLRDPIIEGADRELAGVALRLRSVARTRGRHQAPLQAPLRAPASSTRLCVAMATAFDLLSNLLGPHQSYKGMPCLYRSTRYSVPSSSPLFH